MKTVALPNGKPVPALGQGTWNMAERHQRRQDEIAALREGVALGMTLIDTAEMYAGGAAEELVREALGDLREEIFLVSKAYPQNASKAKLPQACEASLRRLGTDRIDLYLLHWRGGVALHETVEAMQRLVSAGKIVHWGVSNFDTADMEELSAVDGGGCAANQILYNLTRRGSERDLLPWLQKHRVPAMAYSPVEQGRLLKNPLLDRIAKDLDATPAQVALAWVLRRDGVIAIPKAGNVEHVRENRAAAGLVLKAGEIAALDAAFPAPKRKIPLEML